MKKDTKEENNLDNRFWGAWRCAESVAEDLWGGIHSNLLNHSVPFFAYKSLKSDDSLAQIVAVLDLDEFRIATGTFSVGMITSGFTALLPHVGIDYMEGQFLNDLTKYKVEKELIESYKKILEDYKNGKNNSNINNE